jgi:hypothetical protein
MAEPGLYPFTLFRRKAVHANLVVMIADQGQLFP